MTLGRRTQQPEMALLGRSWTNKDSTSLSSIFPGSSPIANPSKTESGVNGGEWGEWGRVGMEGQMEDTLP